MKEKVAVLMGGRSLEREVSLKSGHRVLEALEAKGYPVTKFDVDENLVDNLKKFKPDLVYIALHGKFGEDGTVQELLEILGLAYTGPGVYSSMVGFDKALSKLMFQEEGIPTPEFFALSSGSFKEMGASAALHEVIGRIGLPLVVKPACQGSALGIKFVEKAEDLPPALIGALSYDDRVILERRVDGVEVAASILDESGELVALPLVEVVPKKEHYDFESRYTMGLTEYFVPARLEAEVAEQVREVALRVHRLLKCRDVSRVDIIVSGGIPYVLEINTGPGMTDTSLLPMAAESHGIQFGDLVEGLVRSALARHRG